MYVCALVSVCVLLSRKGRQLKALYLYTAGELHRSCACIYYTQVVTVYTIYTYMSVKTQYSVPHTLLGQA